jgi:hypothetical protein
MAVTFVVNLFKDDPWAYKAMMSIANAAGTLVLPWIVWQLYSWCTQRLRALNGPPTTETITAQASRSDREDASQWPVMAKLMAPGVVIAFVLALLFRYETTPADRGVAFKRDRWSGDTYLITGTVERKVKRVGDQLP